MMKSFFGPSIILPCFFALSCNTQGVNDNLKYPSIVVKHKKQRQFDIAKAEIYKMSTRFDCKCSAYLENPISNTNSQDTVPLLSMDLKLDTVYFRGDSVTYNFSFFWKIESTIGFVIIDADMNCEQFYGVEFIKDSQYPYRYLIAESSYLDSNAITDPESVDRQFKKCLVENKLKVNKWLLHHYNIQ